jgi:hypothetical protein
MRVESQVVSVSWVPSESVAGIARLPFLIGLERHDDPPPDQVEDPRALLAENRVRQVNELRAWVEFDDTGRPVAWDHSAPLDDETVEDFPVLRLEPEIREQGVRFVQTSGGPLGGSVPRRVLGRPFFRVETPISWTTLALTIDSDGRARGELVGSSPFPRHWIYNDDGRLESRSAEIDYNRWLEGAHVDQSPWGGVDSAEYVAAAETALERQISRRLMGAALPVRRVAAGTMLTEHGDRDDTIFLILDGVLDVDVAGQTVAEFGPGAIVGERSSLEGRRSATLSARTDVRVVSVTPDSLTVEEREQLAVARRDEDT